MDRRLIVLLVVLSLVIAGLTACAGLSQTSTNRGKIGDYVGLAVANPGDQNPVGKPLGGDLSKTPAAKGKIGDYVGVAVANPGEPNPVGHSFAK